MGKSSNGPEPMDSFIYLKTVDREAKCTSTILLIPDGSVGSSTVTINILSISDEATPDGPSWAVSTSVRWPNRESRTFEGALFRAVVDHDKHLSQRHWNKLLDLN